jgi:hypothetical protein
MRTWLLLTCLVLGQAAVAPFPQAEIASAGIEATVYPPDARAGYYRGTRFDWSGVVARLGWNKHEYFGEWFERHDPLLHDGITGPVEEFLTGDSALGYDEAKPGETFVRIGVGAVRKPDEAAYRRFATYEIVDPGTWKVTRAADRVTYVHELRDARGYSYIYTKVLRLSKDTLVLEHRLKNIGRKPIATTVYNHNFFTIDKQPTGPDFVVRFAFEPRALRPLGELGALEGKALTFVRQLAKGETVFTEFEGFGKTAADYDIRVVNRKTRGGVRVTADRPIVKFVFWSAPITVCPEPYIDASVAPGHESSWRITYQFYQLP